MKRLTLVTLPVWILIGATVSLNVSAACLEAVLTDRPLGSLSTGYESEVTGKPGISPNQKRAKVSRPTPEQIWQGIKSAAQTEVKDNSPLIILPKFTVKKTGSSRVLTIVKGDVGELGFQDDPYEFPFKKQILIEALRRSLASGELTTPRADLAAAESLVKKMIVDIESDPDQQSMKQRLLEDERQIDEILYEKIYEIVEQEAERKGYNIVYARGGDEIKKFSVKITTVPDGAKVWIMWDLVYRKQLITKTEKSQWPWIEVVQSPSDFLGKYHYLAVWPDGRRAEGDIEVSSPNPIRLLPN